MKRPNYLFLKVVAGIVLFIILSGCSIPPDDYVEPDPYDQLPVITTGMQFSIQINETGVQEFRFEPEQSWLVELTGRGSHVNDRVPVSIYTKDYETEIASGGAADMDTTILALVEPDQYVVSVGWHQLDLGTVNVYVEMNLHPWKSLNNNFTETEPNDAFYEIDTGTFSSDTVIHGVTDVDDNDYFVFQPEEDGVFFFNPKTDGIRLNVGEHRETGDPIDIDEASAAAVQLSSDISYALEVENLYAAEEGEEVAYEIEFIKL